MLKPMVPNGLMHTTNTITSLIQLKMYKCNQLSTTFRSYLNLDMSNPSSPPFPDLADYITLPSPSVSYTFPMTSTPISSSLASPPTPRPAPQRFPNPPSPPPFYLRIEYWNIELQIIS